MAGTDPLNTTQRRTLENLEENRIDDAPKACQWTYAWDAARLASEVSGLGPKPEVFAILWLCLQSAQACQGRVIAKGGSVVADNGDIPSERIAGYLSRLSTAVLR